MSPLQIPKDLIHGEFLQLGAKENEDERFAHYLKKSFLKTASLMALSCKAVSPPVTVIFYFKYSIAGF